MGQQETPGSLSQDVAARVRALMAAQQKSVTQMAEALDLDRKVTKLRYDGLKSLSLDEVETLAVWLGVEPERLVNVSSLAVA